jgi:dihydroorotate dehydrogenase (fumarate)/dihydroorotate dehydrogenase
MYKTIFRPLMFRCNPEWVHDQTIRQAGIMGSLAPALTVCSRWFGYSDERLTNEVFGLRFANPIGLAAGYDKSGKAVRLMAALGFGHVEIGSVSAFPSQGNPKPRLWRLPADRAICVHYGLPNDGAEVVARRLAGQHWPVPLGINIVKTNHGIDAPPDSAEKIFEDYVRSVTLFKKVGDYLCLNLSCPNTETGCNFFALPGNLEELLARLNELQFACPVLLKISPTGGVRAIESVLQAAEPWRFVSGFIFNLPPGKPDHLRTPRTVWEKWPGAVAGEPARVAINECVRELYRRMDRKRYRIIAAGGVFSAEDAYEKIRLGASLVQLLTGLIYEGPLLTKRINQGLCRLLERDGLKNISAAVGTEV